MSSASQPSSPHAGHFAAMGYDLAKALADHGMCHTAMTLEHVMWIEEHDTLGMVGWGDTRTIRWPDEALLHVPDLFVFMNHFGPSRTAALRLGYVFRLGPIGEALFYRLRRNGGKEEATLGGRLAKEWSEPSVMLELSPNSMLDANAYKNVTLSGVEARRRGDLDAALQAFLRCLIFGVATMMPGALMSSAANVASVYIDQGRWFRAYGLTVIAAWNGRQMDGGGEDEIVRNLMENLGALSNRMSAAERAEMDTLLESAAGQSVEELLWAIDDCEIGAGFGPTATSD